MNSNAFYRSILNVLEPLKGKGFRKYAPVRFILSYLRPTKATINGFQMILDRTDETISRMILAGDYESFETGIMKEMIKPNYHVVDIGANIGYYTLLFSQLVGSIGKVYAFEPTPNTFQILKKNIHKNHFDDIVTAYQCGLSNVNQPSKLYINDYNKGDNRLYKSANMKSLDIELKTLDSVLAADTKVDFIKMDIQGAEALAIKGMLGLLARDKPVIVMEFWPNRIKRLGIEPQEMLSDLAHLGYTFEDIREFEHRIQKTTIEELLATYPATTELATNIICKIKN